jgi:transcriptional/translational regulatory protein YebC/TACO1
VDPTSLTTEQLEEVEAFLAALDANEDVQHVYAGLAG